MDDVIDVTAFDMNQVKKINKLISYIILLELKDFF
jgi:hypothetical protein